MTIDIHALLEKNPVTKYMVQPKFGYKYLGAYNPLDEQLLYNKQTGDIYTYYDKPKNTWYNLNLAINIWVLIMI